MMQTIYLGGGCFWCTEAIFQSLKGIQSVTSGYMGGSLDNPSYRDVCSGSTGHAEVIKIVFDINTISAEDILQVFFETHDPTTLNQQGADKGTQYRSVVFYTDENQKKTAEQVMSAWEKDYDKKAVTEIISAENFPFYVAEKDHQNYYRENTNAGYCQIVISPKLEKLHKKFADLVGSQT